MIYVEDITRDGVFYVTNSIPIVVKRIGKRYISKDKKLNASVLINKYLNAPLNMDTLDRMMIIIKTFWINSDEYPFPPLMKYYLFEWEHETDDDHQKKINIYAKDNEEKKFYLSIVINDLDQAIYICKYAINKAEKILVDLIKN